MEKARQSLDVLRSAFGIMMNRIADYILEHDEDIREGGFALSELVDRYGMQLMSMGTVFSNLKSFAEDDEVLFDPADEDEEIVEKS